MDNKLTVGTRAVLHFCVRAIPPLVSVNPIRFAGDPRREMIKGFTTLIYASK